MWNACMKGIHTVVIGFDDEKFPIEEINESYLFIDMQELLEEMEEILKHNQEKADE